VIFFSFSSAIVMSTYRLAFERKESGAPQGTGNVVTEESGSITIKATIGMGTRPGASLVTGWAVHG